MLLTSLARPELRRGSVRWSGPGESNPVCQLGRLLLATEWAAIYGEPGGNRTLYGGVKVRPLCHLLIPVQGSPRCDAGQGGGAPACGLGARLGRLTC